KEAARLQTSLAGPSYPDGPGAPRSSSSSAGAPGIRGSMPAGVRRGHADGLAQRGPGGSGSISASRSAAVTPRGRPAFIQSQIGKEAARLQTSLAGPSYPDGPGAPRSSSSSAGAPGIRGSMPAGVRRGHADGLAQRGPVGSGSISASRSASVTP